MNKEFIPFAEALNLKELGFDEKCLGYWSNWGTQEPFLLTCELGTEKESCSIRRKNLLCKAPLWQQAFRFFKEKYKVHGEISTSNTYTPIYKVYTEDGEINTCRVYTTPDEAELACLRKLIAVVKEDLI